MCMLHLVFFMLTSKVFLCIVKSPLQVKLGFGDKDRGMLPLKYYLLRCCSF